MVRPREDIAGPSRRTLEDPAHRQRDPFTSSATSQTSNTSLSTAFLHLDDKDTAFFDGVVQELPAGATTFAELKRAYNRARSGQLLEQPLDPSRDAALWDTLLRLTHVRGKTWRQRWNAVRETLDLGPRTASEDEQTDARIDTSEDDTPRIRQGSGRAAAVASVQRPSSWHSSGRRPDVFGLPPSSIATESPSADAYMRRRRQSGPQPANEMDELRARMAALSAEANNLANNLEGQRDVRRPILTKQRRATERDGTPRSSAEPARRLRFASADEEYEISKATTVESATDEDDRGQPALRYRQSGAAVAKRRFEEVVARSRHERDVGKHAQQHEREIEEERRLADAYMQADRLFAMYMQQKCIRWWSTLRARRSEDAEHAALVYEHGLRSKALLGWRSSSDRRRATFTNAAKIDTVRCKLRAWRTWTRRSQDHRRSLREARKVQLRGAYEVTRLRHENRLINGYYGRWRAACLDRRAERFRREHLLRGSMALWRIHLWRSSDTRALEVQLVQRKAGEQLDSAFARWQDVQRMRELMRVARAFDTQRVTAETVDVWSQRSKERRVDRRREAIGERWLRRRVKGRALQVWRVKAGNVAEMQRLADDLNRERSKKVVADCMHHWTLREREALFLRIAGQRVSARFFGRWRAVYDVLRARLRAKEVQWSAQHRERTLGKAFRSWRQMTEKVLSVQAMSAKRDERKVLEEAMSVWKAASERRAAMQQQASALYFRTMTRRTFELWIRQHQQAKLFGILERNRLASLRRYFSFWRAESTQKRSDTLAVARFRGIVEHRKRREVLQKWIGSVIDRKSTFMEAAEGRDRVVLQRAWQHWLDVCIRHDDMLNLSNSFLDVKREEKLRTLFKGWLGGAQTARVRREKAERFAIGRRERFLVELFERWYDRYAEATLRQQELECLMNRQAAVKGQVLARWRSKTQTLPAVQLHQARLKSHAFHHWRELLPFARRRRMAGTQDRLTMQAKAFEHWQHTAKARRAFRAAARFGGPSAARLRTAHRRISAGPAGAGVFGDAGVSRRMSGHRSQRTRGGQHLGEARQDADISSLRESDLRIAAHPQSSSPSIRQWRSDVRPPGARVGLESSDAVSEPGEDPATGKSGGRVNRFRSMLQAARTRDTVQARSEARTPSPASRTQSEVTLRIRNSPRKGR